MPKLPSETIPHRSLSIQPVARFLARRGPDLFAVLLLLGLYSFWAYSSFTTHSVYRSYDPEFDYFMTSLAPFNGMPYAYVDHPGTPVEVLGTLFFALTWPLVGGTSAALVDFHLRHPTIFFHIAYAFELLANLACALYFYITARLTGRVGVFPALALALLYYALDASAIGTITYWSHAAFSFPFGTLYLLVLFRLLRRSNGEIRHRALIGLGIATGVLTSIILYMAPWVVGTAIALVLLYRLRGIAWGKTLLAAALVVVAALAGFFMAIIPILWKWPSFWRWVLKLFLNQGRFGNGEPGIFSLSATLANLSDYITRLPLLFTTLAVLFSLCMLLLAFPRLRQRQQTAELALAGGLLVQILLLLLIITKASFFFYLLPVQATVPVLALVVLCLLPEIPVLRVSLGGLLAVLVFSQVVVNGSERSSSSRRLASAISADQAALISALQAAPEQLDVPPDHINIIWTYGIFEQCNVLLDGNYHAGFPFDEELTVLCPRQHFLPHGSKSAFVDGVRLGVEEVASRGWIIVMRSSEAAYILDLLPTAKVQELASSSSGLGDIVLIYP